MDIHTLQFPKRDTDVHTFYCYNIRTCSFPKNRNFSPEIVAFSAHVFTCTDILWICCIYKSIPATQYHWNISDYEDVDNSLHYYDSKSVLRKEFFSCCYSVIGLYNKFSHGSMYEVYVIENG